MEEVNGRVTLEKVSCLVIVEEDVGIYHLKICRDRTNLVWLEFVVSKKGNWSC